MTPLANTLPRLCIPLQRVVRRSRAPPRARARGGAHPVGLPSHAWVCCFGCAFLPHLGDVLVRHRMLARLAVRIQWDSSGPRSRPSCWKTDTKMVRSSLKRGRIIGKPQQIGTPSNQTGPLNWKSAVPAASACARHGRLPASCDVLAHARLRSLADRLRKLMGPRHLW